MIVTIKFRNKSFEEIEVTSCVRVVETNNQLLLDIDGADAVIYDFDELDYYTISNAFI